MVIWGRMITGRPITAETILRRKVGALARHRGFHQKVGITNDPDRRWRQAYAPIGWHDMHVLYSSSSHSNVRALEKALIEWLDVRSADAWFYNEVAGGGGRAPSAGPFYVYVVNAPKYARSYA